MANSVDPDQTPRSAASDRGQHCLHMRTCPKIAEGKYGNLFLVTENEDISCITIFDACSIYLLRT